MPTLVTNILDVLTADFPMRRGLVVAPGADTHLTRWLLEAAASPREARWTQPVRRGRRILAVLDRDRPPDPGFVDFVNSLASTGAGEATFVVVTDVAGEYFSESDLRPVVLHGEPAIKICRYAEFMDADLILMVDEPRSAWSRLWKRSLADEVLSLSKRPVQLVSPGYTAPAARGNVVCVLNLDGSDVPVLEYAEKLAERTGASLSLLHPLAEASEAFLYPSDGIGSAPLSSSVAEERLRLLAERLRVPASICVLAGPVSKISADLVIAGRGGSPGPTELLRKTRCPVVSVPAWLTISE